VTDFDDEARPTLRRGTRLQWDDVRDQHVLLIPEGVVELNPTAVAVLELCDGERSQATIIAALEQQYPEASLGDDVRELIAQMAQRGFLVDAGT